MKVIIHVKVYSDKDIKLSEDLSIAVLTSLLNGSIMGKGKRVLEGSHKNSVEASEPVM